MLLQLSNTALSFSRSIPALGRSLARSDLHQFRVSLIVSFIGLFCNPAETARSQFTNMKPLKSGAASSGIQSGISLQAATFCASRKASSTQVNSALVPATALHSSSKSFIVTALGTPEAL